MQKRQAAKRIAKRMGSPMFVGAVLLLPFYCVTGATAQSLQVELKDEHDPIKRSDKALAIADSAFDSARAAYAKEEFQKGDAQLDEMTRALDECVSSLETIHKSRLYKKAEMRVAFLQRRLRSLLDEITVTQRGWADQTQRKLEEIHDKLLEGAMKK